MTDNPINPPIGMNLAAPVIDIVQQRIDRILSQPPPKIIINPMYSNLPDIRGDFLVPTMDFRDDCYDDIPGILLCKLTNEEIISLGKTIIPMIQSGFSQAGAAGILVLAYQLRDPSDGGYIFVEEDLKVHVYDVEYDTLDNTIRSGSGSGVYTMGSDPSEDSKDELFYPFLAASMLRLFIKADESYLRAFDHIKVQFDKMYNMSFNTAIPIPNLMAIRGLAYFFRSGGYFKSTLFKMLYSASGTNHGKGVKGFLYEIHLANTGIHIMNIFIRLREALSCPVELLISAIDEPVNAEPVAGMVALMGLMTSEATHHERKMWRFGRVFEESFMCQLQTKSCSQLVYVLAAALRMESYPANQNILNIKQLEDVSAEKRRLLDVTAQILIRSVKAQRIFSQVYE